METDKIVVGLDIGTTKICAVVGRKNEYGKLEVLGMGKAVSDGVVRGVVSNIDRTVAGIEQSIREAERQSGINIRVVNVGIAGQHIKSSIHHGSITRDSTFDEISVEDVRRLTNDMYKTVIPPGSEIIHVMPQDYMVDYEEGIKDPVGMRGAKLEADFHVITAQANAIFNVNKCIKRAGLDIESLILEPLASSLAVLSTEEKQAGVCLVDIGGGTTDIAIFHENIIRHTAVIPFGGNIITDDIKQGCMVMDNQAEQLKVKFGKAIAEEANPNEIVSIPGIRQRPPKEISVMNLAHIIEARMEEIIELVHAEIITSGYDKKLAGGIVITGGGSQLANCRQLFEYMTGMDARIGHPNEHLGKSKVEEVKSPMYATSVGLVLSGFRGLDDRENRYFEKEAKAAEKKSVDTQSGYNYQERKTGDYTKSDIQKEKSWWKSFLNKTRDFIIDDIDDDNKY
ncbi:cell division protein FtsA [Aureibacter tunicatorum]|uniref:Cell division protein FtsA n=1 Tax=Aureibacter tunicatorum TaxID=866807 RepID=A0AAE4BUY3_9BACT|nr:cell division protein FtsA [Aureibacter tunicatorum]MDR6241243.1 cell division protein FtsA [Aureibacter tunicatorum]